MVAKNLLDLVKKYKVTDYYGLEDTGDKISFQLSVVIFMLCGFIVGSKTYIAKPMSCYSAITPTGANFDGYIRNYCWVAGTVPVLPGEPFPEINSETERIEYGLQRINYYQWVPFVLALQCILFYLPRLFWQVVSYNKMGIDMEIIFADAFKAANDGSEGRTKKAKAIAKSLGKVFHFHRDYRDNTWARFRRRIFGFGSFFMMSHRLGNWMTYWYLVVKFMFLANAIGQLYLIQRFLGFEGNNIFKTTGIFYDSIINGVQWTTSRLFPRVTHCPIDNIKLLGVENQYITQCVLPQNMLNEKVYMFLWFWLHIVVIATVLCILKWFRNVTFGSRAEFIKKFLKNQDIYQKGQRGQLDQFIQDFLRHDGTFILMMMNANCGDLVTTSVVSELWEIYQTQYASSDSSSDNCEKDPNLLNLYPNISSNYSDTICIKNTEFI